MTPGGAAVAFSLAGGLLLAVAVSEAHVVLDGETAQPLLREIARCLKDSTDGVTDEARVEALFLLGDNVQRLTELMNLDLMAHGKSLYVDLLARGLQDHRIRITRSERSRRYAYDMAAFREYLKKSPHGRRAGEIRFRLIAERFYASIGTTEEELVGIDVDGLRRAIREEEAFLRDYPAHERAKEVRLFLGMDYYRLSRGSPDRANAVRYRTASTDVLRGLIREYPGTSEARAAEVTLDKLLERNEAPAAP
jgi:hypothetical protein